MQANLLSVIVITGYGCQPIQEFIIPHVSHPLMRNRLAQLGQASYKCFYPGAKTQKCQMTDNVMPHHSRMQLMLAELLALEKISLAPEHARYRKTMWEDTSRKLNNFYGMEHGPIMGPIQGETALTSLSAIAWAGRAVLQLVDKNEEELGNNYLSPLAFTFIFETENQLAPSNNEQNGRYRNGVPLVHKRVRVNLESTEDYENRRQIRVQNSINRENDRQPSLERPPLIQRMKSSGLVGRQLSRSNSSGKSNLETCHNYNIKQKF